MSDYTPTTEEVRTFYAYGCGPEHTWDESLTDFDRWLALIIEGAEQRGAVKAGRAMLEQAILDMDTEFGAHL